MIGNDLEQAPYVWSIDAAIEGAKEDGFTIVRSQPDRILLDLDDAVHYRQFMKMMNLSPRFDLSILEEWRSKSGKGYHAVLKCKEMPFPCRIAIALALGSDPIREGLAIAMHLDGLIEPSVLFKPQETK